MSDLQEELSIPCELHNVRVFHSVSADPDIFFVIDEDAMFAFRPLVLRTWSTPPLDDISSRVEFKNRRRWSTTIGLRWIGRSIFVVVVQASRPGRDPEMVMGVDERSAHLSEHPVVRQRFRPER